MASTEERVSFLEGRVMEQSNVFAGIRMVLDSLDARVTRVETRLESRFDQLDHKIDQRFAWLIGMQVTTILAFVGAVVALVHR